MLTMGCTEERLAVGEGDELFRTACHSSYGHLGMDIAKREPGLVLVWLGRRRRPIDAE